MVINMAVRKKRKKTAFEEHIDENGDMELSVLRDVARDEVVEIMSENQGNVGKILNGIWKGIGILFLLFLLFSSVAVINAGEVGVLLQFGEVQGVLHPGIHFIVPFMNNVNEMSTQIEKYETDASAASKDLQIVSSTIAVNYRIEKKDDGSILTLFENFRGGHEARLIQPMVQEAVKASTAQYTAEELITKRTEVKSVISSQLKEKLSIYGISVEEVAITNFDFSEEFNNAIESKVAAEQQKLEMQIELDQKKIEVQKMIAEANASAESAVLEANGDAQATLIRASAEAQAIQKVSDSLTEAQNNEGYLTWAYIAKWDGEMPTVLGDSDLMIEMGELEDSGEGDD